MGFGRLRRVGMGVALGVEIRVGMGIKVGEGMRVGVTVGKMTGG